MPTQFTPLPAPSSANHTMTILRRMSMPVLVVIALFAVASAALLFVPPAFAQGGEQPADNQAPSLLVAGASQYESRLPRGVSDASVATVVEGRVMEFQAYAQEPECEQIGFAWTQTAGTDAGSLTVQDWINLAAPGERRQCWARSTMRFTAPAVNADTALTFTATATDSGDNSISETVTVWVLDGDGADNTPPTAMIAASQVKELPARQTDQLVGSGRDAETHLEDLGFQWSQVGEQTAALERADRINAGFTAPDTAGTLHFRLTVTDAGGLTHSADVQITVTEADLTPDPFRFTDYDYAIPDQIANSDVVTISGLKGVAPLSISAPAEAEVYLYLSDEEYRYGDDALKSATVKNGDTLELEARANPTFGETVIVAVTVGEATVDWRITTRATAGPADAWTHADLPDPRQRGEEGVSQALRWDRGGSEERFSNRETPLQVGDAADFWISGFDGNPRTRRTFRLAAISERACWWIQQGMTVKKEDLDRATRLAERRVFPRVTEMFGDPRDSRDSTICTHVVNANIPGVGGYVYGIDWYPASLYEHSNETEALYMNSGLLTIGSDRYLGVLAHELQHVIHKYGDEREEKWVNEGLSELAEHVAGYPDYWAGFFYLANTADNSLITWGGGEADYNAAGLFAGYLYEHYVGDGQLRDLVSGQETGGRAIDEFLAGRLASTTEPVDHGDGIRYDTAHFHSVFADWMVANRLDWEEGGRFGRYGYADLDPRAATTNWARVGEAEPVELEQYAIEYIELPSNVAGTTVAFAGDGTTPLLPTTAPDGGCWWSGQGGYNTSATLTRSIIVPATADPDGAPAKLSFRIWHDIEEDFDYLYLEASTDGGATWTALPATGTVTTNPNGNSRGPGYTGSSDWLMAEASLADYAGRDVMLRFHYETDPYVNGQGACVHEVNVTANDATVAWAGEWEADGFTLTTNRIRQDWIVRLMTDGDRQSAQRVTLGWDAEREQFTAALSIPDLNNAGRAALAVAPVSAATRAPATYRLRVTVTAVDTEPNAFEFDHYTLFSSRYPEGYVEAGETAFSSARVTGINAPAPVSVSAPVAANVRLRINNGNWLSMTDVNNGGITVSNGDRLRLRATPSEAAGDSVTITVTVGGVSADWSLNVIDDQPDAFSFASVAGAEPGAAVESEEITVSGINYPAPVLVFDSGSVETRSQLLINGEVNPEAAAIRNNVTISNGDVLQLRTTASTTPGQTHTVNLYVGVVSADWVITTAGTDTTPDRFAFTPVNDATPGAMVASNTVAITGVAIPVPLSVTAPAEANVQVFLNDIDVGESAMVNDGDALRISATASVTEGGTVTVGVTIGGVSAAWVITSGMLDTIPDSFSFQPVNAGTGIIVGSDTVTISGINAPAPMSISAPSEANVRALLNGSPAADGATVNRGDTLQLKATASEVDGATVTVTVVIGGIAADWTITTAVFPTACAGDDLTGAPGDEITLQGTCSDNPYGPWWRLQHQWEQISGPVVTLTHPQTFQPAANFGDPRFTIPADAAVGTTLEFQLTVTDQEGGTDADTVVVTVVRPDNTPPAVTELASARVFAGATVELSGSATDAEDGAGSLSFAWEQTVGTPTVSLDGANTATASFAAPTVSSISTLTFRLSVTDSGGLTASRETTVTILPLPTACAGPDLSGAAGAEVTLQGKCSANPYGPWWGLQHQWEQNSGPDVTLTHPNSERYNQAADKFGDPRFTIPDDAASGTTLEFRLTVTDEEGGTDADTVTVTVTAASGGGG